MKRVGTALITAAMALSAAGCKRPGEPILPDESRAAPAIAPVAPSAAPAPVIGGVKVDAPPPPPEAAEPEEDTEAEADVEGLMPPPPEAIVENPGPAPSPDHHWVEGYWRWDLSHYVWEPGYWVDADDGAPYGPPAEPSDDPGYAPGAGYLFMPGYWRWSDGAFLWMAGHWAPSRSGFEYVRPRWERTSTGRWSSRGGYWVPQGVTPRDDYQPAHPSAGKPVATAAPSGPVARGPAHAREGDRGVSTYGEAEGHSLYGEDVKRPGSEARAPSPPMDEIRPEAQPSAPAGRGWQGRATGSRHHGRR